MDAFTDRLFHGNPAAVCLPESEEEVHGVEVRGDRVRLTGGAPLYLEERVGLLHGDGGNPGDGGPG